MSKPRDGTRLPASVVPLVWLSAVERILLLTDGQAHHGIVDPTEMIEDAEKLAEDGINTTTIGYVEHLKYNLFGQTRPIGRI